MARFRRREGNHTSPFHRFFLCPSACGDVEPSSLQAPLSGAKDNIYSVTVGKVDGVFPAGVANAEDAAGHVAGAGPRVLLVLLFLVGLGAFLFGLFLGCLFALGQLFSDLFGSLSRFLFFLSGYYAWLSANMG